MKITKTIEKYDKDGKLTERTIETTETIELSPLPLQPFYPGIQPVIIQPQQPYYHTYEITCTTPCVPVGNIQ